MIHFTTLPLLVTDKPSKTSKQLLLSIENASLFLHT